jgi:hypothetical protein
VECLNTKSLYDLQVKTAGVAASNAKFVESVAKYASAAAHDLMWNDQSI